MADRRAFRALHDELAAIGRNPATQGMNRFAWTSEDGAARHWFRAHCDRRGMAVEQDACGNLWGWWGDRAAGPAIATGSHLDTVPEGGAYDGAFGVVSAFLAIDELRGREVRPTRPVAVIAFADEEGARFGVATFGSRCLTGALDAASVVGRVDIDGTDMRTALGGFGVRPELLGGDRHRLDAVAAFVELHIEQGRGLADTGHAIATATGIGPHGRWRLTFTGVADHAGTTRLDDRRDPTLPLAATIESARTHARRLGAVATVGRITVAPNGTNVIPRRATGWLDARAPDEATLDALLQAVGGDAARFASEQGVDLAADCESRSPAVTFDAGLRARIEATLTRAGIESTPLATAAGHDAGVLAAVVPAAMVFVRNPTGASHTPAEAATDDDCVTGVCALAAILEDLAT